MRRREFVVLFGVAAAGWPLAARGQQPAVPVIGFVEASELPKQTRAAFVASLNESGYVEDHNVTILYRTAEGHNEQLSEIITELVHRQVRLIVSNGPGAVVAKSVTGTTPIIFFVGSDPVKLGIVDSLSRPGGNLTGVTTLNTAVGPKRLELLHELVPSATNIAVLVNPTGPSSGPLIAELQPAADRLGIQMHTLQASTQEELFAAFTKSNEIGAGALLIGNDAFFTSLIVELAALSNQHRIPSIYQYPDFVVAGGLMSYGASITEAYRVIGNYAARVLKGEKPADLPVQQSTKIELVINRKTAKTLGITVPDRLLALADEVIE
jgi:putative tryptophan/tyrosine transport system substrate-binding protein